MATNTKIEWTDATWNPIIGCSRVSEGCRHCYAERIAGRFPNSSAYAGLTKIANGRAAWTGQINETKKLLEPLSWRQPKRIFVNSMSDLFHENMTDGQRDRIFAVMALCPQHRFQVLTKRPKRMLQYLARSKGISKEIFNKALEILHDRRKVDIRAVSWNLPRWPLPNVWLGVSDEGNQHQRIEILRQVPSAVRLISAEPLIFNPGTVDLTGIHWVIAGGESGPGARPMHPDWARSLRDQCQAAGVPFFFKQWGEWEPVQWVHGNTPYLKISVPNETNFKQSTKEIVFARSDVERRAGTSVNMIRVGKKAAGALLDGREWREFPKGDE